MMSTQKRLLLLISFTLYLVFNPILSSTLWVYDPSTWRAITHSTLTSGESESITSQTLEECKTQCINKKIDCLSFTWGGDISSTTATSTCLMYRTRFGFVNGGMNKESNFGTGSLAYLEEKDGTTYFEKPMDFDDTLGEHLILNGMRLNNRDYAGYLAQNNEDPFDYDQSLMYYRAPQPGYVNNSVTQSRNKYSVIMEYDDIETAEQCALLCTRNRGAIDPMLGTRCASFNYNTFSQCILSLFPSFLPSFMRKIAIVYNYNINSDGRCHLLTFSLDTDTYKIEKLPSENAERVKNGWFYYEGLVGAGCYVVQSQCRKWDDPSYKSQQDSIGNTYEVGVHVGVIKESAVDLVCSKCSNTADYIREYEYICLDYARQYHEDKCDNDADSATVAYWAQDGAGAAEIWASWDLSEGCVIDLTTFDCDPDPNDPKNSALPTNDEGKLYNPRYASKIFRDSIGEDQYAAALNKDTCFGRAKEWYDYCRLGEQKDADGNTKYLTVTFATDGSYYLEPAIPCYCDGYGLKIESTFGLNRKYCTRDSKEKFCYREKQQNYWADADILCDDLTEPNECELPSVDPVVDHDGSGCYLYYPQPTSDDDLLNGLTYRCAGGGKYGFDESEFMVNNSIYYRELMCNEVNCDGFDEAKCVNYAQEIHQSCGNDLEIDNEQIMVWYAPTGSIMTYPNYAKPYEFTIIRGITSAARYTEDDSFTQVDFMPIRNGRWQTFSPSKDGNLRQLDVYYYNNDAAVNLTCTIWSGVGITASIYLNQVQMNVPIIAEAKYIRFPLDNITLTAGETYTWQITALNENDPTQLGYIGYVRGNGYGQGVGDLAWDYLFVAWIEGIFEQHGGLAAVVLPGLSQRPWFEIWCIMIIILFLIFAVFLLLLHCKRKYDEEQERREDKIFQAEIREHAMLSAEAERMAKQEVEDDYDEDNSVSDGDAHSQSDYKEQMQEESDMDEQELETKKKGGRTPNQLTTPDTNQYDRVVSYSKNEMPGKEAMSDDGKNGYQDPDKKKKKKKKKKRKKAKKKQQNDDDDGFEEY